MNLVTYWSYIGIIFLISFIPGFAIASRFKELSPVERIAVSFGISFALIALLALFPLKLFFLAQFLFTGIIVFSLWFLLKRRSELKLNLDARFIMLVFIISLISRFFFQTLWEYPVMGGDWFLHTFRIPYTFEIGDWAPPTDKTPLFSLLIYSYHNLFGSSLYQYWFSQIISVLANSVYILPAYLIAKNAFGDRVAKVSALFMLVTPFLIFNTLYTWPKNAAMYGVFMMIYFLFFSGHEVKLRYSLAGFFAGLGFLFHNYALFYILIAVLLLVYIEKMYKGLLSKKGFDDLKKVSLFLLALLLVLAPYFAWVYSYYGTISTSKTIYYPIAVKGYDSAFNQTPEELWANFEATPLKEIIMPRISNIIVTLTPAALPINPVATSFPTYNPIYYYTHDYPGALSALMYLLAVIWFLRYITGRTKTDAILIGFIVLPLLIVIFLYGWREWGLLPGLLQPTLPLLIMIGFNEIYKWNNELKYNLIYIIFISAVIENFIFGVLINRFYLSDGGVQWAARTGQQFISDFQISDFISAHFLLNSNIDMIANFLISIVLIILVYIFLYKRAEDR